MQYNDLPVIITSEPRSTGGSELSKWSCTISCWIFSTAFSPTSSTTLVLNSLRFVWAISQAVIQAATRLAFTLYEPNAQPIEIVPVTTAGAYIGVTVLTSSNTFLGLDNSWNSVVSCSLSNLSLATGASLATIITVVMNPAIAVPRRNSGECLFTYLFVLWQKDLNLFIKLLLSS